MTDDHKMISAIANIDFVICELNTVSQYNCTFYQLPNNAPPNAFMQGIMVTNDHQFLIISIAGHNSIYVYRRSGTIYQLNQTIVQSIRPYDVKITQDHQILAATGWGT